MGIYLTQPATTRSSPSQGGQTQEDFSMVTLSSDEKYLPKGPKTRLLRVAVPKMRQHVQGKR